MKGFFKPNNPQKYKGDPTNIVYRSSWECKFMMYLDAHPDVLEWASEELSIPYLSPKDNRIHRYFPDFWVKFRNKIGKIETVVYEIKPKNQTVPPKKPAKQTKRFVSAAITYAVNVRKWEAAKAFCEDRGMKFQILTERELNLPGAK